MALVLVVAGSVVAFPAAACRRVYPVSPGPRQPPSRLPPPDLPAAAATAAAAGTPYSRHPPDGSRGFDRSRSVLPVTVKVFITILVNAVCNRMSILFATCPE